MKVSLVMIVWMLGRGSSAFMPTTTTTTTTTMSSSLSRYRLRMNIRTVVTRSMATVEGEATAVAKTDDKSNETPLPDMDEIVSLCKRRGIIFPSSEIYNGFAGFYDYGPLGCELKKNVKDAWWKHFVTQREDVVGLDSSIIHNPKTWKSSGMYGRGCFLFL